MPTYDYRCKACGHEFELFQSMSARPEKKCPACGKNALERLIGTGAALLFKGSGFYQTDYRSESYKKAADADKPSSSNGDTKSGETKPSESKTGDARASEAAGPKADKGGADRAKTPEKPGPPKSTAVTTPKADKSPKSRKR